jgi:hypothetical protein
MKVYIEPNPKATHEGEHINHYKIEKGGGSLVDGKHYQIQKEAHKPAKFTSNYNMFSL